MEIINGREIAGKIINSLKIRPAPNKIFAAVLAGKNPASISFLKLKEKTAKELGVDFKIYEFPENIITGGFKKEVSGIAGSKEVGGIIVQLPLPKHIDKRQILNVIPQEKDVDVLSECAAGVFINGHNAILPPAVGVVDEILKIKNYELKIMKVAVVGPGFLIGRPVANWLMNKVREVYVVNKGSDYKILKHADLIIVGAGKAGLIKPEMLKDGAGVIDFGVSPDENGKLSGDFTLTGIQNSKFITHNSGWYTPTPGGTGPILVAKLMENFLILNKI